MCNHKMQLYRANMQWDSHKVCVRGLSSFSHSLPSISTQKKCVLLHITLAMVFDLPLFKGKLYAARPSGPEELKCSQAFPKISNVV